MAALKESVNLYQSLTKNFNKKNPDLVKCDELLKSIKISLTRLSFLPASESTPSPQEFVLARDVLEVGAQLCIMKNDIPGFERYMSQLKCYYLDQKDGSVPESPYKHQLLGLNLLCLLSQNRVAEFHTELERLPAADIQNNIYIRHPISMEQYLMEGSYNKLFLAKGNVPAASYNFFIDILLGTIQDEIAACIEKAYPSISVQDAMHMLYFESEADFVEYAKKREWQPGPDRRYRFKTKNQQEEETVLASPELASQIIDYARELEMII